MRGNPWYSEALALATGGRPVQNGEQLTAVARVIVMLALEAEPRAAAALPRAWPVSGALIRAAARDLQRDGLIEGAEGGPQGILTMSPLGWDLLTVMKGELRRSA